jgi:DNA-binding MarR family transcriptional regulator
MAKATRHERVRNEIFPGGDERVFDTKAKGFVPIPIEFRLLLRYLTPPQIRVLLYLQLRTSKEGLCFPTVEEIAHDIGVGTPKHVRPHLKELERKGFIEIGQKGGRTFFLMREPALILRRLLDLKEISDEQLRDINSLRENLGRDPVGIDEDEDEEVRF